MDPVSLAAYSASAANNARAIHEAIEKHAKRYKGSDSSDRTLIEDSRSITEQITGYLSKLANLRLKPQQEGQVLAVFSDLLEVRGVVNRARNRQDVLRILKQYRGPSHTLDNIFGNHNLEDPPRLQAPDRALETALRPKEEHLKSLPNRGKDEQSALRYNLQTLIEPDVSDVDIVFVHGLCGDARGTWSAGTENPTFWPEDFLRKEKNLQNCQVLAYSYDTSKYWKDGLGFDQIAQDFANALYEQRRARQAPSSQAKFKGFVLVAHSLGGLVVRAALVRLHKHILSDLSVATIFFGTPHSFSSPAAKAAKFKAIISATATSAFSREDIERISETSSTDCSTDTAKTFQNLLEKDLSSMPIVSFFEDDCTLTDNGYLRLVDSFSGMNAPSEKCHFLAGDHLTMCKFESREESGYSQVVRELEALVDQIRSPDMSNWISTSQRRTTEISNNPETPKLYPPHDMLGAGYEASSQHQRLYSGGTKNASISSKTTEDVEQVNVSEEYKRLRPWFEVPLAKWHSSRKNNTRWGNWFVQSPEFQEWLTESDDKTLLIRGPSGCGKTMIAESVLESVREKYIRNNPANNICLIQLFFRSEDTTGHDVCSILKALIAQILDLNETLTRHVTHIAGREVSGTSLSEESLFAIFGMLVKDTCWSQVLLVVDAIDECATLPQAVAGETKFVRDTQQPESPHLRLVHNLMSIPPLRFVATLTQEEYGLPTSLFTVMPDNEEEIDVSLREMQPSELQSSKNTCGLKEIIIPKVRAFEETFEAFLRETIRKDQVLGKNRRPSEADSDNSNRTHTDQADLDLFLLCWTQSSFRTSTITIKYCIYLWNLLSSTKDTHKKWPLKIAELRDRHVLYSKMLSSCHSSALIAVWYLPRLLEPVSHLDLEMILSLMQSDPTDLEAATGDLERDLRRLIEDSLFGLVYEDSTGLHMCSDDFRRFCLAQSGTEYGKNVSLNPFLGTVTGRHGSDTTLEVHFRIAKACLRLLRLHKQSQSRSRTHVQPPNAAIPGLKYAEKYWNRHAHLAGPKAIELNDLIYEVQTAVDESPVDEGLDSTAPSASTILHRLALNNLSFNISTMFSGSDPNMEITSEEISKTFDNVVQSSSVATIRSLHRLASRKGRNAISERKSEHEVIFLVRTCGTEDIKKAMQGSDPASKETFLKYAIQFQNLTIIRYIIEQLNKSHLRAPQVLQAWKLAVSMHDQKTIELMAMKSTLFDKNTSLLIAASVADATICHILLKRRADPNYADENHAKTALHIAAATGQLKLVQLLLRWRAQPAARDSKDRTPLHCATEYGHTDVVGLLLRTSTLREELDRYKRTPLFIACAQGYKATAAHLWSSGSNLSHRDQSGRTVLHAAAARGSSDVVHLLLEAGVPVDAVDSAKRTPLHEASRKGYSLVVEILLMAGASPFKEDIYGHTPLHKVCFTRTTPEVVARKLLGQGAAIDAKTKLKAPAPDSAEAGSTPLHLAAYAGTVRLVKALLGVPGATATLFDKDSRSRTPLLCANDSISSERTPKKRLLEIVTSKRRAGSGVGRKDA